MSILALLCTIGCTKTNDTEALNKKAAEEFVAEVTLSKYRLVDFYSDQPIDYNESDNIVKSETDLRAYIKPYLLDDINEFDATGSLKVYQGAVKIPGNDSTVLTRTIGVNWDKDYTFINFVDYYYDYRQFKLQEFNSSGFIIYLNWHTGAKVYSKFTKVN